MLEDLAANLLQRLLGRYVQGLEGRNLRVAVWSGRVVLENLSLRPDALLGLVPATLRLAPSLGDMARHGLAPSCRSSRERRPIAELQLDQPL